MTTKKIFSGIVILILSINLNANEKESFLDMGIRGHLYDIKEKSFKEDIAIRIKNIDYSYWEKEMLNSANKSMILTSDKENCIENKTYKFDPTVTIEQDITVPYTKKILFKKGYKYNALKENKIKFGKYQIFIDADDSFQLALAQKYSKNADIFIVKGNIKNLIERNIEAYSFRQDIEGKAFKINCLPTVYAQDDLVFNVSEYILNDKVQNGEKK